VVYLRIIVRSIRPNYPYQWQISYRLFYWHCSPIQPRLQPITFDNWRKQQQTGSESEDKEATGKHCHCCLRLSSKWFHEVPRPSPATASSLTSGHTSTASSTLLLCADLFNWSLAFVLIAVDLLYVSLRCRHYLLDF